MAVDVSDLRAVVDLIVRRQGVVLTVNQGVRWAIVPHGDGWVVGTLGFELTCKGVRAWVSDGTPNAEPTLQLAFKDGARKDVARAGFYRFEIDGYEVAEPDEDGSYSGALRWARWTNSTLS